MDSFIGVYSLADFRAYKHSLYGAWRHGAPKGGDSCTVESITCHYDDMAVAKAVFAFNASLSYDGRKLS